MNIKEFIFLNENYSQTNFENYVLDNFFSKNLTTEHMSKYNSSKVASNVLLVPLVRALMLYLNKNVARCGVGSHGDFNIAKLETASGTQICVFNKREKEIVHLFQAPILDFDAKTVVSEQYHVYNRDDEAKKATLVKTNDSTIIWLSLLPELMKDALSECPLSAKDLKNNITNAIENRNKFDSKTEESLFLINDNIYRRVRHVYCTSDTPEYTVEIKEENDPSLVLNTVEEILSYEPTKVYAGSFEDWGIEAVKNCFNVSVEDLPRIFSLAKDNELTAEQKAKVPKIESWYIVPDYLVQSLKAIKMFNNSETKFQNILLSGRAGSGKSKAAEALAYALNLPFYPINCNPNTDEMQLTGGFAPNINKGTGISSEDMPSFDEIELDPAAAYEKVSGKSNPNASPEEVYNFLTSNTQKNQADFIVTKTALTEAVRNGGVIELQEIALIKDSGMLGMLNSLMDNENEFITIPTTGEVIKRHKNCVIVATTNVDYAGCRPINTAFKDRFKLHFLVENPSENIVYERAKAKTQFEDKDLLKKVVKSFCEIVQLRIDRQEEDSATLRCLYNWLYFYQAMDGMMDMKECAEATFLSKLSFDKEEREEARSILDKYL